MQNTIELMFILAFLAGLVWGAYLDRWRIKYQIKKQNRLPKFLSDLGVVISPERQDKDGEG